MARSFARGDLGPGNRHRRSRCVAWWVRLGWSVVSVGVVVFGWRQFRSGHVGCAFEFEAVNLSRLAFLNKVEEEIGMLTKAARPKVDGGGCATNDTELSKKCPCLHAHLCQTKWDDGTARVPSTLSVFTGDGCWKACLRDRELALCLWVAAKSFVALTAVLEAALTDPATVWRADRVQPGSQASRRRKD